MSYTAPSPPRFSRELHAFAARTPCHKIRNMHMRALQTVWRAWPAGVLRPRVICSRHFFYHDSAMIILIKRRPLWRVDTASHTPFIHTPVLPHTKKITYAKQRITLVLVSPVIHRVGTSLGAMHISCRCCNVRVWMHGRSLSPVTPLVATRSHNVLFRFSHLSAMLRGRISTHDVPRPASKHT